MERGEFRSLALSDHRVAVHGSMGDFVAAWLSWLEQRIHTPQVPSSSLGAASN